MVANLKQEINDGIEDERHMTEEHHASQGSNKETTLELSERIVEQYNFAAEHQVILDKVIESHQDEAQDAIGPGAVVLTNNKNFFISIAIEDFFVDGKDFVGLSPKAPIYVAMEGKKAGDSFSFRNMDYTVEDIF